MKRSHIFGFLSAFVIVAAIAFAGFRETINFITCDDIAVRGDATIADDLTVTGDLTVSGTLSPATTAPTTLTVGSGTQIFGLRHGTLTIATGDTSGTLTLAGVATTDRVFADIMTGNSSSRSVIKVAPGSGSVQVVLSGTPGASTDVSVLAIDTQ